MEKCGRAEGGVVWQCGQGGGGGQRLVKFCGRPLWMVPKLS